MVGGEATEAVWQVVSNDPELYGEVLGLVTAARHWAEVRVNRWYCDPWLLEAAGVGQAAAELQAYVTGLVQSDQQQLASDLLDVVLAQVDWRRLVAQVLEHQPTADAHQGVA